MIFNYLTVLQVYGIQVLICAIGCICSAVKFFTTEEAISVLRIIRIMSWPAMSFREIAKSDFTLSTYKPLLHSFLTQCTIHLVAFLASFLFPRGALKSKFSHFLEFVLGFSYNSFMCYGYPMIRILFGEEYLYIPVIMNIIQTMIMKPLHLVGLYSITSAAEDVPTDEKQLEDLEKPLNTAEDTTETALESPNMKRNVVAVVFSTVNLCAIAGVCWSIIRWKFPIILEIIIKNFEMSVIGTTLFCVGVMLWSHPLGGCDYKRVGAMLVAHHIINPLIALLWTWILGFDQLNRQTCTLLYSMPIDWSGVDLFSKRNAQPNSVTYAMFWSQIISLPCIFLWIVVFNHTNILSV